MPKRIRKKLPPTPPSLPSPELVCPECKGKSFTIVGASIFDGLKCSDCAHIIKPASNEAAPPRISEPGVRHRRDKGPSVLGVQPVLPPSPDQLGSLHSHTAALISGGPNAAFHAHHEASKLSKKFGEEFEAKWFLKTKWLEHLETTHRARARYALVWRPRFLATVALTRSVCAGTRAAKVHFDTVGAHRREDPDFDAQCIAAEEHAVELLHDVAFRRALEGDCEPIFWQGIPVGHVKKFDGRLQIEMLRAHKPGKFKTPGSGAAIVNNQNNTFVVTSDVADLMIAARQEALQHLEKAALPPVGGIIEAEVVPTPA